MGLKPTKGNPGKIAYRMGFSDSLNAETSGARKDILRWAINDDNSKNRYFRGYKEGWRTKCEVLNDRQKNNQ